MIDEIEELRTVGATVCTTAPDRPAAVVAKRPRDHCDRLLLLHLEARALLDNARLEVLQHDVRVPHLTVALAGERRHPTPHGVAVDGDDQPHRRA